MDLENLRRRVDGVVGEHTGEQVRAAMRAYRLGEPIPDRRLAELAAMLVRDVDAIRELEGSRVINTDC